MGFPGASATPGIWTLGAQGQRGLPGPCGGPSSGPSCVPASLKYMEKLSQLAYHPLKMHSCYEKMEPLRLDGLQQRFDVSSMSVFKQRAQIHMREVGTGMPAPVLPTIPRVLSAPVSRTCSWICLDACPSVRLVKSDSPLGSQRPLPPGSPPDSLSSFPQGPDPLFSWDRAGGRCWRWCLAVSQRSRHSAEE